MRRRIRPTALVFATALFALGLVLCATRSPAEDNPTQPKPIATQRAKPQLRVPNPHGPAAHAKKAAGGDHESDTHGSHAAHDENAPPPPINWWHGLLGTKEGVHPNLLWRGPEDPPPFLASLVNFALFAAAIAYFGRKPLAAALVKRKESIMREIEEARKTRDAAEQRLAQYEAKIERMGEEIERLRRDFREQGERDKARIIAEANDRRERMRQDAQLLLSHELEQTRRDLTKEAVDEASRIATELLTQRMTLADHERFVDACFTALSGAKDPGASAGAPS
jgi:F-type H+-transporting ATPase subunit b